VKRWHYFALAAAVVAGAVVYTHRNSLSSLSHLWSALTGASTDSESGSPPTPMSWQTVARPNDGFRVELPADPRDLQAPAFNETGGAEPIQMIMANPGSDTLFAVTWQDNPPVARVNNHAPERTLKMARDGMLERTQTAIVSQSLSLQRGNYPSLDVSARNGDGGILDARLILAGNRLYVLMALFPSASARREKDVARFFDSFVPARPAAIPDTMPVASHN
jgi:hypothetical protein